MTKITLLLGCVLCLVALPANAQSRQSCHVARVHDGDTLKCQDGTRVRLLLINAPELSQKPFGQASGKALRDAVLGKTVWLEADVQRLDRYGRLLAYVWTQEKDGIMLNELMARSGLAVVLVYPPNVKYVERIRAAARQAQQGRVGLWEVDAFSCSPADHRRGKC